MADTALVGIQAQGNYQEQPLDANQAQRLQQNRTNALQEADPDPGDEFGNSRKPSFSTAVADAQLASRTDGSYFSGTTNQGGYAQSDIQSKKKLEVGTNQTPVPTVGKNPLHDYASHTYSISLHMLSKADFNQMGRDPDSNWVPSKTIIGGAGKWGVEGFTRDKNFLDDFYFDNLKVTTIIGSTAGNQGTNSVELSFTVIEPYGVTLIDRLIDACLDPAVDGKNYIEIPYLIQIDYYGYDDEGISKPLTKQRKYIPINILTMNIKAGIKGAEYQMSAVPYAHTGFQESIAATPANFEVIASTLEEYFADVSDANDLKLAEKFNQRAEAEKAAAAKEEKTSSAAQSSARKTTKSESSASGTDNSDPSYTVKSYVSAYNAWGKAAVANKNATDYNSIKVVFDDRILKAANGNGGKIVNAQAQPASQVPTVNPKRNKQASQSVRSNYGKPDARPNFNQSKFTISGQTSVIAVINNIMLSSEYIRSQVIDTTKDAAQNSADKKAPVNWWKVIPEVKLRSYCPRNSKWYLDVTYYVKSYTVYNRTHPNAPKDMPKGWHREYNYIYTGQNNDIIEFNIEFDTAFYTAVTIDRNRVAATLIQASPDQEDTRFLAQKDETPADTAKRKALSGGLQPATLVPIADNVSSASQASNRQNSVSMATASLDEHVMSGQSADQLNIRLRIIGDPQFIKQDEIYYSPSARRYNEEAAAANNYVTDASSSIAMDNGEVHIKLSWKTPVDIDEETGSLRINGNYFQSAFSGIFQVLTVESTFAQGKFEQVLDCIRLPDQPADSPGQANQTNDIRQDNLPTAKKDGETKGYQKQDSQSVEALKTSVLTKLLENKSSSKPGDTAASTDDTYFRSGTNLGGYSQSRVDTSPEQDQTGYGEEYQNSQARALSNINRTAPTETANEFFGT